MIVLQLLLHYFHRTDCSQQSVTRYHRITTHECNLILGEQMGNNRKSRKLKVMCWCSKSITYNRVDQIKQDQSSLSSSKPTRVNMVWLLLLSMLKFVDPTCLCSVSKQKMVKVSKTGRHRMTKLSRVSINYSCKNQLQFSLMKQAKWMN